MSIAETVVCGVAFDPKNGERVARMDLNRLYATVGRLFDLLDERGVDYVLAGGVAMLSYVEGRNTQDIDLVLSRADLDRLPELRVEEINERFARTWLDDLRVDALFSDNEPFKTVAMEHVTKKPYFEREVHCASEEGMLLMKLFAIPSLYRQARFDRIDVYQSDLTGLLRLRKGVSDSVWRKLSRIMLESDIAELRKIVADIEQKIAEGGDRFGSVPGDG
ncbi:nucleotidyltransferase family protein [Pseudobythopirellula maris]|uniref:nucleotidyltransferase family protein n=1 Tax=Pseudobythopirellula maris TaxID=2527991 RepID=UPI0011B5F870|nr:nucleotidyltransferase family protein [Pseudobythopirellula maris]